MEDESETTDCAEDEPVLRLVYSSAATSAFDEERLLALLEQSRERNRESNISGMLLHHEGTFLQVLEGEPEVVNALFAKIERDPRHEETRVLLREEIPQRAFGDWTMGFIQATRELIRSVDGLNDFLQLRTSSVESNEEDSGERTRRVLEQFKEGRWRREIRG